MPTELYTPEDTRALTMENDLLTHEVRHLRARVAELEAAQAWPSVVGRALRHPQVRLLVEATGPLLPAARRVRDRARRARAARAGRPAARA